MSESTRRLQWPQLSDVSDLLDPLQQLFGWRTQTGPHSIRIETHAEPDAYIVRAQLPGIDPDKDVEVTVADGTLTIHAEHAEQQQEHGHSEFRYGSFHRSLRLPEGAGPEKATATYHGGILTVRVGMDKAAKVASRKIEVTSTE
jgi:HSP20 family protein